MTRLISHRIALLALALPACLPMTGPAAAAAAKPAGDSFRGSAVLVSASAGCADRRNLAPGERFDFTYIRPEGGGDLLVLTWRPGFRMFMPPGKGAFGKHGRYTALTSYDGKNALIYEGTYENFARKPAKIDAATARIELSFTTRNQDKSKTCTTTWRASGKRVKHVPAQADAMTRRLATGQK
jgi:hypothetical protein